LTIEIPKYADIRQLVIEQALETRYIRSITLYGPDDMIISRAEIEQDEDDPESRYFVQNFERGACMVGIYGHEATEVFTTGIIHCFGFYMARLVDEKEPEKTKELEEEAIVKIRPTQIQDDAGIKTPF